MTKQTTVISLIALAFLVLMLVMPASAGTATTIKSGATVFIGEQGLDLTPIIETTLAWTNTTYPNWSNTPDVAVVTPVPIYSWANNTVDSGTVDFETSGYQNPHFHNVSTVRHSIITHMGVTTHLYSFISGPVISSMSSGGPNESWVHTMTTTSISTLSGWANTTAMVPTNVSMSYSTNVSTLTPGGVTQIAWWASGADISTTAPSKTINLQGRYTDFSVSPSDFVGYTGNWYRYTGSAPAGFAFSVADPQLELQVQTESGQSMNGKSIAQGTNLNIRVDTNMYSVTDTTRRTGAMPGFIDLKVKSASGATYNQLINPAGTSFPINNLVVDRQPYVLSNSWNTGALDSNSQYTYPVGSYVITAESTLNNMKDNYRNGGADYTGKTVSAAYTVTLISDAVKIEANKDTVVRSKSFSVTVTGKPNSYYYLWVKGTGSMTGKSIDEQAPMLVTSQEGVDMDPVNGSYNIGSYKPENYQTTLAGDVSTGDIAHGTRYYALIHTSSSGTRTVEWTTNNWTKAQKYTIRVETNSSGSFKNDEVDVNVERGAVTVIASGEQSYYLGEEIKLSGTNTETYQTYLFIIGPNLQSVGSQIQDPNPRTLAVKNGDKSTFKSIDVAGDNTWSWKWGTSTYALDAGTYTVYAVSQPNDRDHLQDAAYGTVSIIIKKPFISATASQSVVAQGDKLYIVGVAEGQPAVGVRLWILGKNYETDTTTSVSSDGSFKYEIKGTDTKTLASGQYFLVAQHPMQNGKFDINKAVDGSVRNEQLGVGGSKIFTLLGAGSLQGSDAAEALIQGINNPDVDDTYTKLQFLIENPIISVQNIGDKHVGDKFTITADTNLAVDDEILVEVYSSSFKPTQKSQSGEFSGSTGAVKVSKGDSGMNKIVFDVDSSTYKPDEYIVKESAIIQDATGTALFNVLEMSSPTMVIPTVATVKATEVPTAVPTTIATAVPTPVPTTKSPGYGALIALIGLGAVAFIVVRRE